MHGTCWKVEAYFQTLDVDVTEGAALFNMLDDGDGQVGLAVRAWVCYHVRILIFGRPSFCLIWMKRRFSLEILGVGCAKLGSDSLGNLSLDQITCTWQPKRP